MRKLGYNSPGKYKIPPCKPIKNLSDDRLAETPSRSASALEMPDLESIIREFEMGYLSPKKREVAETSRQGSFVKKIVAAFEVKYKLYNESRLEQEDGNSEENRGQSRSSAEKRKALGGNSKSPLKSIEEKGESKPEKRRSDNFSTPLKSAGLASRVSSLFSSPDRQEERKSEIYASPVKIGELSMGSENGAADPSRSQREDSRDSGKSGLLSSPFKSSLDDTCSLESVDLSDELPEPEETIILDRNPKEGANAHPYPELPRRTPLRYSRESEIRDKTPKVVGAFLKKPIEVEDTSIDWIPITGKRLPRKRSLKKLLSAITGRKKSKILFRSERNLSEEPRELQDSGYEERSCSSSSSLTSLLSITEVLLEQENGYVESARRSTLRTFRSSNSVYDDLEEEEDEAVQDVRPKANSGKLLLSEVPREELKLDLGPTYPTAVGILTMSLDRRSACKQRSPNLLDRTTTTMTRVKRLPRHPFLSSIPKHPFVTMSKMEDVEESQELVERVPAKSTEKDPLRVEFRGSCGEPSPNSSRSSSSVGSDYDVPRKYLSRSEPEISEAREPSNRGLGGDILYDVPKSRPVERPRSSLYEDALSLKRRSAHFALNVVPDFYAFANDGEPHYATVKPRSRRVYLSKNLLESTGEFNVFRSCSSF
ncbi:hypothetical protein KM043_014509 [Ampulex compressa]|nr:hypothetical protein KM043_014509 [Ampulex compressa]